MRSHFGLISVEIVLPIADRCNPREMRRDCESSRYKFSGDFDSKQPLAGNVSMTRSQNPAGR